MRSLQFHLKRKREVALIPSRGPPKILSRSLAEGLEVKALVEVVADDFIF
jgi:hypothetical protein